MIKEFVADLSLFEEIAIGATLAFVCLVAIGVGVTVWWYQKNQAEDAKRKAAKEEAAGEDTNR